MIPLSAASTPSQLDCAWALPYQEDDRSINDFLEVTNTVTNVRNEDVHIIHKFFVIVDDPDSVALIKYVILGKRDTDIFDQAKNVRYMQNVATKMKIDNGANWVDVTNAQNYRTSMIQIVKYIHTFSKKWILSILCF